ncbi:MAG: N-acetyltransferase [Clostridia bacterium]|nr:N-acetyltransferase [Clostridia bacterium]
MTGKIEIRMAKPEDAAALLDIYAPYVLNTGVTYEYEVPEEEIFRKRIETVLQKYPYLVATQAGKIIGYAYAKELGERAAFSHSVETVIYLGREQRGKGIGKLLYGELERILKLQQITNLYAAVSYRENEDETITHASPRFHLAMGYRKAAHFSKCGYKFGRWYDLVWYEKHISAHSENQSEFLPIGCITVV